MGFLEELRANNIDPDKYIELQNEFLLYCRKPADEKSDKPMNYRDQFERDQALTELERFINILERARLQEKIRDISGSSTCL